MGGVDHERERMSHRLLRVIAEQPADRAVDRLDAAVFVEDEDPLGDVVEHRLGEHIAVTQRRVELRNRVERLLQPLRLGEQVDERRHLRAQDLGQHGGEDEVDRAARVGACGLAVFGAHRGHEDDRGAAAPDLRAAELGRLEPVQRRHPHIHQDHRDGFPQQQRQRRAPRGRLEHCVTQRREHRPQRDALVGVVVDDEDLRRVDPCGRLVRLEHHSAGHHRTGTFTLAITAPRPETRGRAWGPGAIRRARAATARCRPAWARTPRRPHPRSAGARPRRPSP